MTQPAPSPQPLWWQTTSIQNWSYQTWRYYSWRPGYRLTLTTSEQTAYVNMRAKVVVCNPEYPYPSLKYRPHVRGLPKDVREFQLRYLESLIAHEAGHTHHTGDLPAGLLGQLVNIIEDERMERRMARTFPELRALFQFAADADAAHTLDRNGPGGDAITGCLLHRFTWHHPVWAYVPDQPDAHHWPAVKEILEAAWEAPAYEDVVEAARQILKLLGIPENAPRRDDLERHTEGNGLNLSGSRGGAGPGEGGDRPGGEQAGGKPEKPMLEQQPTPSTRELQSRTLGLSRHLAGLLRRKGSPARTEQSRDRGHFRYDRYATGSERYFQRKVGAQAPGLTHLRLAVDISGSMLSQGRMDAARELTFALIQAAQLADIPMLAVAFDDDVLPIADPRHPGMTALNQAARLAPRGGTELAPALAAIWKPVLPGESVTFIITDGGLSQSDYAACALLKEKHTGMIVPILLASGTSARQGYEQTFGRCVPLEASQLQSHIVSFLRAFLK